MKVLLLKPVPNLGQPGKVVEVAEGYARNFLIAKGLARLASDQVVREAQAQASQTERRKKQEQAALAQLARKLKNIELVFKLTADKAKGTVFGSVHDRDIAQSLSEKAGAKVKPEYVALKQPLKKLGSHKVAIRLPGGLSGTITVVVQASP